MTKAKYFRELEKINMDFDNNFSQILNFKLTTPKTIELYQKDKESIVRLLKLKKENNADSIEFLNEHIEFLKDIPSIVYPMSLVYAISHFEVYLSRTTSLLLEYFWKSLKTKNKTLNYEEILSFDSISDLKDDLIEKEIQKIAFGSIKDRIHYLEEKINLVFEYKKLKGIRNNWNSIEFEDLIEIHSTRNIIIHNNSIINEFYLKDNKKSKLKIGETKLIDSNYTLDSLFVLFRVSLSIYNVAKEKVKTIKKK